MIYFIQNEVTRNVKIGHSNAVKTRLRQLQQGNDCPLKLVAEVEGGAGLERQYHDAWHQYRIHDKGAHGDEWFSIDVYPTSDGGVKIRGRKLQRARTKRLGVYRRQHCLRLTDQQEELLQRYAAHRDFPSAVSAVRAMIDGLEDWFRRQEAKDRTARGDGEQRSPVVTHDVMEPESITDVEETESITDADDESTSVGDFGGRPRVSLPESRHDGND